MADINGIKMSDDKFMLTMELGNILSKEGYDVSESTEIDRSRIKSARALEILDKLEKMD